MFQSKKKVLKSANAAPKRSFCHQTDTSFQTSPSITIKFRCHACAEECALRMDLKSLFSGRLSVKDKVEQASVTRTK